MMRLVSSRIRILPGFRVHVFTALFDGRDHLLGIDGAQGARKVHQIPPGSTARLARTKSPRELEHPPLLVGRQSVYRHGAPGLAPALASATVTDSATPRWD